MNEDQVKKIDAQDVVDSVLGAVNDGGMADGVMSNISSKTDELIDSVKEKIADVLPEGIADQAEGFIDGLVNKAEDALHAKTGIDLDLNGDEVKDIQPE